MSVDHDALMRSARQLIAKRIAILNAIEALRRNMEQCLDDSEARIGHTRWLLQRRAALLQQAKIPRP